MFEIFYSNSLDNLADRLAQEIRSQPLPPLENETFIIQSEGMAYWLRLNLATRLGCASGFNLLFPGNFCRNLSNTGNYPQQIVWEIYAILSDTSFILSFPVLHNYLRDNDERKRLQLARRLEGLLSEYLIYRHEMLLSWENGAKGDDSQQEWQAELWRRLAGIAPRAQEFQLLLEKPETATLPSRICVFGVSTLPPLFLRFLQLVSAHCPVLLFLPVPTEHFWADLRPEKELLDIKDEEHYSSGHPLISSLATQGKEFFQHIIKLDESGQSLTQLPFHEPGYDTALHILQTDMKNLRPLPASNANSHEQKLELCPTDRSVEIHCCHSPLREVEVLHEQLLDLLDKNPELQPSDILVVMSDVEEYAPWVKTVFSSCPVLARHFRISERSQKDADPAAQAFIDILRLPRGRQDAAEVMALLDYDLIREKANIELSELSDLRSLISQLNIRWGIGSRERAQINKLDIGKQNTWRAGLERLLLAYATGDLSETLNDILPYYPELDFDLVGRFALWVRGLFDWCSVLSSRSRPVSEWKIVLNRLAGEILGIKGSDEDKDGWINLNIAQADPELSLKTISEYVENSLSSAGGRGAFLGGGISFCALLPMRAVPFSVVAMLGMDFNRFPRRNRKEGFNLMLKSPQLGDRNPRNDDRQLFLETILSSQQKLLITYSGHSAKDLGIKPPSVCVSELCNCLDRTFICANGLTPAQSLTVEHPLQPFSERYYNSSDPKLFTYDKQYLANNQTEAKTAFCPQPLAQATIENELTLDDFIAFWLNPAAWFCQKSLRIFFPRSEDELAVEEPLLNGGLDNYRVNNTLLPYTLAGEQETGWRRLSCEGMIPPMELGKARAEQICSEVSSFCLKLSDAKFLKPQSFIISLPDAEIHVSLKNLTTEGLLNYRMANVGCRDLIRSWLSHLALCTVNKYACSKIIGTNTTWNLAPVSEPEKHLAELYSLFSAGQKKPLAFFPNASHSYYEQVLKLQNSTRKISLTAQQAAINSWNGNDFKTGDCDNEYIGLCFNNQDALQQTEFSSIAETFWQPFFNNAEETK